MNWTSGTPNERECKKQKLKRAISANENLNEQQDIDKVEQTIDDTMKHLQEHAQDKVKRWCYSWMKRSKLLNDEYAGLLCYDLWNVGPIVMKGNTIMAGPNLKENIKNKR